MTRLDLLCLALFVLSLILIGTVMVWQAYRRANPKPRLPGPFTSVYGSGADRYTAAQLDKQREKQRSGEERRHG